MGFLGETPDGAVTDHQEKLLRPKVRVKSSQSKKKKIKAEAKICLKARGREDVLENKKFSCVVMEESELTGLYVSLAKQRLEPEVNWELLRVLRKIIG